MALLLIHTMAYFISFVIGEKKYMFGEEPHEVDCAIFGMLALMIYSMPDLRHACHVKGNSVSRYCKIKMMI